MENTQSSAVKYIMTNKATGETQEVFVHSVGDQYVDVAPASEAGTDAWINNPTLTRFVNAASDGVLTNDVYDIHMDLGPVVVPTETVEAVA